MRVRGRRRCTSCDHRWSYFETGSPACPACGSLRSVAVDDEPTLHTHDARDLDLDRVRAMYEERPLEDVAVAARSVAREYVRSSGFVDAGDLADLDDRFLAAAELAYVADHVRRAMTIDEPVESHFLALLRGADDGERPDPAPESLRSARGLAVAEAVETYRREIDRWVDGSPSPEARPVLDGLRANGKRIAALDGDVPAAAADTLIAAARDLGRYLRDGDESALATAEDRLERLG